MPFIQHKNSRRVGAGFLSGQRYAIRGTIAPGARQRRRGISTSMRRARKQQLASRMIDRLGGGRNGRTYLWALQSRSIRMSSSEDSAAAARPAAAGAEHIPRPRARAAAATRRASAAAMPARTTDPAQDLSGSAPLRSGQPLARADAGGWLSGCRAAPVVKISRRAAAPGPN